RLRPRRRTREKDLSSASLILTEMEILRHFWRVTGYARANSTRRFARALLILQAMSADDPLSPDALFQSAFEFAAIGMALVSPEGKWLRVNRSVCKITGYNESELLERTFQDITHPDDLDQDLEYVRRMLAGEIDTYQMEKRYYRKDDTIVWILL